MTSGLYSARHCDSGHFISATRISAPGPSFAPSYGQHATTRCAQSMRPAELNLDVSGRRNGHRRIDMSAQPDYVRVEMTIWISGRHIETKFYFPGQ